MDYQFPQQLFPSLYTSGPPDPTQQHFPGKWGSYERVRPQDNSGPLSSWTFVPKHRTKGEAWHPTEPLPVPFLLPKQTIELPITPPDPLDFTDHLNNFYMEHSQDAFGCMTDILSENFDFHQKRRHKKNDHSINMWRVNKILKKLNFQICPVTYYSKALNSYSRLLSDVVPAVCPELLGSLLYEELTEQRERLLFCEATTGGALEFVPYPQSSDSSQQGCLLYPSNLGLDLHFQKVALQPKEEGQFYLNQGSDKPFSFQLKGSVRQLTYTSIFNEYCVGVRSDYHCGVWRFSESNEPHLLQVVNTADVASCISVSPHVLGEVLVASESVVELWTLGKGMQRIRTEDGNLYFNDKSSWKWCEFTAHPRVMLYADRTGAELTDIRVNPESNRTLFKIGCSMECLRGERVILCKYLKDIHSFHHLITTQYSAYIMDERFPSVPMLKFDHMMDTSPVYCHVLSDAVKAHSAKILLGSQRSQQITMLQYTGGQAQACCSLGPPQALLRPTDSLNHLPVQIPHRLDAAAKRLSSPATGLTSIQTRSAETGKGCICVVQLTEAGDIFYQILQSEQQEADPPQAEEDILETQLQAEAPQMTPSELKMEKLRHLKLNVFINDDPMPEVQDKDVVEDKTAQGAPAPPQQSTPLEVSDDVLIIWKRWLQKLSQNNRKSKPHSHLSRHFAVKTEGLFSQSEKEHRAPSQTQVILRRAMRAAMSERSLLPHSVVSDCLQLPLVPFPNQVDPPDWSDSLSQRLVQAWQGKEAWQAWWDGQLGVNKKAKMRALLQKRRREKVARRAAGQQYELSTSFSSASCVSETDDLSSWSAPLSPDETTAPSQLQSSAASSPSSSQADPPRSTPATPSWSVEDEQLTTCSDGNPTLVQIQESKVVLQRIERPAEIVHTTQVNSSQENPSSTRYPPTPPSLLVSSSLRSSSSQRSQSQRSSSSQASQVKKKSRMGF